MSTVADDAVNSALSVEEHGYHKSLKPRQLQMIAIGGAIGTGLFLGAGERLNHAGPGLFIVYAVCGLFVFFVLRALGELVLHRPSSGSFVSYAREFYGEKAAFVAGWMYFLNWAMTGIADSTAIAQYFHYWGGVQSVPQWVIALIALALVLGVNLASVKWFGEMEFWAALVKVTALVAFLLIGAAFLVGRFHVDGLTTGPSLIAHNGGLFPTGVLPLVTVTTGVVFAYAAVEMVGTAAGETQDAERIMPRAINSVIFRIAVFYVGSLVLLGLLLPYTAYSAGTSPFVTFFAKLGLHGMGSVMNIVVLTAAFSSLNAGLYSTGRILRSMAMNGSAPSFTGVMSDRGVPYGGILLTATIGLFGVLLNKWVPHKAFEIVLNVASLGIIASWATILLCQLKLWWLWKQGRMRRPAFRMVGAPVTGVLTLAFLVVVVVLMAFSSDDTQRYAVAALLLIVPALIVGWFLARKRVLAIAEQRMDYTGEFPVVRPVKDR
ncbi:MAG: amino acid permease [Mycobacteriaceae bacterium]|nr:amino acid permease [Mycobacteriaceae bacterium]